MQPERILDKSYMKILGEIIKFHRKKSGKSVYLISAESCIAKSSWRELELGKRGNINLDTFCKIAEGLEMSPTELMEEFLQKLGKNFSFIDLDE